jgi:hypothetical protein
MKRFFAVIFSFLLVAFLSTAFNSSEKKAIDKDVGYSLIIDQNQMSVPVFVIPTIGESQYSCTQEKISLISSDYIINEKQIFQPMCYPGINSLYRLNPICNANNVIYRHGINRYKRGVYTRLDIGEYLTS